MTYQVDHYFKSVDEMAERFREHPEALVNTSEIAERCSVELDKSTHHLPEYPVEPGETLDSTFVKETRAGFEARREQWDRQLAEGTLRHSLDEYEQRLDKEIETIVQMGFSGYFLIVGDFIAHARRQEIPVGPGRGSAAGSLVAYCLKITDIDPLQYDLIFERFLNPERVTMPDIDIDFCFRRRGEVIEYVTEKYGRENVAQIITFGTMAARAALRDAGRVLDLPYADVDRIAKLVPEEIGTRLADAIEQVPQLQRLQHEDERVRELLDVALRLEGLSRHASTHAAGVVITPRPVTEFAPLFKTNKEEITTQWAKDEIEGVGLLKMDFLGLKTLTLLTDTLNLIEKTEGRAPDLDRLGLDDPETFALFSRGETTGVFQFESFGMRDILRRLGPERFEDLIALNALYRPGPLGSGMIEDFIQRRHGKVEVSYPHPKTEPILEETYGVIVYQEQVMKLASTLAGYTLGEADLLRRAMGKKKQEAMDRERVRFLQGAKERDVTQQDAEYIFDLMAKFAGYGFNKSHSAAYALVAYQTAYLKTHYPLHFMAALLTSEKDHTDKLAAYIGELRDGGVRIDPPSVNRSHRYFEVHDGGILFGLAPIKGIGEGAVDAILEARERIGSFASLDDICCEVDRRALNRKVLESLIKSGSLDEIGDRARLYAAIDGALDRGARAAEDRASGQVSLFGEEAGAAPEAPPLPDVPPWTGRERLAGEKEALGLYLSGHPLDDHRERMDEVTSHSIRDMAGAQEVAVGGLITALKRRRTKSGEWMARFSLEDTTGHVPCVVFPRLYREVGESLEDEQAVVVSGRAEGAEGEIQLLAERIVPLDQAEARAPEGVTVRLRADHVQARQIDRVAELLSDHPGPVPVFFEVVRPGDFRVVLQADEDRRVKADRALLGALNELLGKDGARLGRPA
jgi:DNA polymerase-3 subunit alpha